MKIGQTHIGKAKLVVIPRHRIGAPGEPASLIGGVMLADIAPESPHGDVIECEVTITITRRYRANLPLGDLSDAVLTMIPIELQEAASMGVVDPVEE